MTNLIKSKSVELLTKLVREKIDRATGNWEKPFFSNPNGAPRNVFSKIMYSGFNTFLLGLIAEMKGYEYGAWATFKQYAENGFFVRKGEKSIPVTFWKMFYVLREDSTQSIKAEEYYLLTKEEKGRYKERIMLKEYYVFNVEQTNMKEANPGMYEKVKSMFSFCIYKDNNGEYSHKEFDRMIDNQSFICPIKVNDCGKACFRLTSNLIIAPSKRMFKDEKKFYATLAHECAHATMIPLNRVSESNFGSAKYAREELVAEIASAIIGMQIGISTTIEENNAQYLQSWETSLKEEDQKSFVFLYNVVKDAVKASEMVLKCIYEKEVKVA